MDVGHTARLPGELAARTTLEDRTTLEMKKDETNGSH
jgi:hypothetical protein